MESLYSNFLYDDKDAFDHLFVDVSEEIPASPTVESEPAKPASHGLKSLFSSFDSGNLNTLLLLFYMLSDCEEDERLIIIALYFLMGI